MSKLIQEAGILPRMPTDFGKRVKAARKHAELNQKELAAAAGVSQSNISQIESSAYESAYTVQIATACGVDAHWLATGEGEMLPAGGRVEASNVTALPAPALRGLAGVLTELQTTVDGLSPLLQDAARVVLVKWMNGQASLADVVATIEGLQQISAGTMPGAENRAA